MKPSKMRRTKERVFLRSLKLKRRRSLVINSLRKYCLRLGSNPRAKLVRRQAKKLMRLLRMTRFSNPCSTATMKKFHYCAKLVLKSKARWNEHERSVFSILQEEARYLSRLTTTAHTQGDGQQAKGQALTYRTSSADRSYARVSKPRKDINSWWLISRRLNLEYWRILQTIKSYSTFSPLDRMRTPRSAHRCLASLTSPKRATPIYGKARSLRYWVAGTGWVGRPFQRSF